MNSFELNKVVGAGLSALLAVTVIGFIGNILMPRDTGHGEHAEMAIAESAQPKAEEPVLPIANRLAEADVSRGEAAFKKCAACHTVEQGGANKVGPNLFGVVGGPHAHIEGFAYSDAMRALHEEPWTFERLDAFLANPRGAIQGTKMSFAGIRNPMERADVILYMREHAASAVPLPEPQPVAAAPAEGQEQPVAPAVEVPATAIEEAPAREVQPQGPTGSEAQQPVAAGGSQMAAIPAGDPAAGERSFKKCQTCHSVTPGQSKPTGPNLHDVYGRTAGTGDYSYSDALVAAGQKGLVWDEQSMFPYLEDPKAFLVGYLGESSVRNKMNFKLRDAQERANIIAYLKSLKP